MTRLGLALAAVAALAFGPPALAQKKPDGPAPFTKEQRDRGMKEAPAAVQSAGVACTVTDAGVAGTTKIKDATGKEVDTTVYEVACKEGMGYALLAPKGGPAKAYDCLTTAASSSLVCRLPANANPAQGLQPFVAAAGNATCQVANAKALGSTPDGKAYYEVKCADSSGFILEKGPSASRLVDCAAQVGTNLACTLTTQAEIEAAQKKKISDLVALTGRQCAISGSRVIGPLSNGKTAYEVACGPTGGFVMLADATGAKPDVVDCARADYIAGGCTLTNAVEAKTQEAALYTKLAKGVGFDCNVSKYRVIGTANAKDDVVELACNNRPDGAIAIFRDGGNSKIYDCVAVTGAIANARCQLTTPAPVYAEYTRALSARGKSSCKVSDARFIGSTKDGSDFVETACSDGLPGWVIEFASGTLKIKSLLTCGQATGIGAGCTLPTNKKK